MAASLTSAAQIVNASLARIGYKRFVGNLFDGSDASGVALAIYGQTRDELIRKLDPDFAQRSAALTLLKQAPAGGYIPGFSPWDPTVNPPVGYLYEYAYPADCLKLRVVKPTPLFFPNVDPQDNVFKVTNDAVATPPSHTPPGKVILCNVQAALAVYAGRVVDPTQMNVSFIEALIDALGGLLAPALTSLEAGKEEDAEAKGEAAMAMLEQG